MLQLSRTTRHSRTVLLAIHNYTRRVKVSPFYNIWIKCYILPQLGFTAVIHLPETAVYLHMEYLAQWRFQSCQVTPAGDTHSRAARSELNFLLLEAISTILPRHGSGTAYDLILMLSPHTTES